MPALVQLVTARPCTSAVSARQINYATWQKVKGWAGLLFSSSDSDRAQKSMIPLIILADKLNRQRTDRGHQRSPGHRDR